ncbi:MAG: L-serine ammonia-lyase, iron-sulfur-dependent, subunit alpha, partial [Eubacteriales bacterium]|nr:L-serine ammonia-lyase, iron-sulfur-dependent, subunit alpha [Eubacteriales bacterium]
GEHVLVRGVSKGGGVIELISINEHPVSIAGDKHTTLLFVDQTRETSSKQTISAVKEICGKAQDHRYQESSLGEEKLIVIASKEPVSEKDLQRLEEQNAITKVCVLPPVFPVVVGTQTDLPFTDADELSAYCSAKGVSLFEAAVAYEQAVSGWSRENVLRFAKDILSAMRRSIREGLSGEHTFQGIVRPMAPSLLQSANARQKNGVSAVLQASIYALAIMEYSNFSGVVVCAPTAGASGVLAGTLVALGEAEDADDDRLIESLLSAGVIGAAISAKNDFCGGVYGCQAEVGCASCMAAAAAVHMMGGTVKQAMDAASMALQNMLGLICDPVCGLVQVPCFSRNITGVSNAITCAQMCMLGYDPVISLQSAFEAMKASGEALPAALKGCGGGLCATACGKKLMEAYYDGAATL